MAKVNLWELITSASRDADNPRANQCDELIGECSSVPKFGSEFEIEFHHGSWTFRLYSHEDPDQSVQMTVSPTGGIQVSRCRTLAPGDVQEERKITIN